MAFTQYPVPSSGGVKSIQRGTTTGATTVTITAVDINKSFVTSYGTESSGNVSGNRSNGISPQNDSWTGSLNFGTSFVSQEYGAYLLSSTELVTTGSCRWEVVEFN